MGVSSSHENDGNQLNNDENDTVLNETADQIGRQLKLCDSDHPIQLQLTIKVRNIIPGLMNLE